MVKPAGSNGNTVADDLIWKDHVSKEWRYAKKWPENWGFLSLPMIQNGSNEPLVKTAANKTDIVKLPSIKTNATFQHQKKKSFPVTTTGFIGWKSADPKNNLDKYGKYSRPVKTFLKQMNWSAESLS